MATADPPASDLDPLRYRDAGVDVVAGEQFAHGLADLARPAHRPEVLAGIGGFASLFALDRARYEEPVLVSGTDGVGTKLLVAERVGQHDTIGIDLVAMCVNDVLTTGAEPLFFLDYFATGRLDKDVGNAVLRGIVAGCAQAGCALVGGETAEMPGLYAPGHYDLAGFAVGVVERAKIIDGKRLRPGDVVLGLPSSGVHSNGFSLVRHVLARHGLELDAQPPPLTQPLGPTLLTPTRIYVRAVQALLAHGCDVRAMAHVTGGGLARNLVRVMPDGLRAVLDRQRWTEPPIFGLLRRLGVPDEEMDLTFNLGLGFLLVVPPEDRDAALASLRASGEAPLVVGHLEETTSAAAVTCVGAPRA